MDNVIPKDVITTVPAHWCAEKRAAMRAAIESTGLVSLGVVSQLSQLVKLRAGLQCCK